MDKEEKIEKCSESHTNSNDDLISSLLSLFSKNDINKSGNPLLNNTMPDSKLSQQKKVPNNHSCSEEKQNLDLKIGLRDEKKSLGSSARSHSKIRKPCSDFNLISISKEQQHMSPQSEVNVKRKSIRSNAILYSGESKQKSGSNNLISAKMQQSADLKFKPSEKVKSFENRVVPYSNITKHYNSSHHRSTSKGQQSLGSKVEIGEKEKPLKSSKYLNKPRQKISSNHLPMPNKKQSLASKANNESKESEVERFTGFRKQQSISNYISNSEIQQTRVLKKFSGNERVGVISIEPLHNNKNPRRRINNLSSSKTLNSNVEKSLVNIEISSNSNVNHDKTSNSSFKSDAVKKRINNKSHKINSQSLLTNSLEVKFKDINYMKNLICKKPNVILQTICDSKNQFLSLFSENVELNLMAYIIIALGKATTANMYLFEKSVIKQICNEEKFMKSVNQYLVYFPNKSPQQIQLDSLVSMSELINKLFNCMQSPSVDSLINFKPILKKTCEMHFVYLKDENDKKLEALLDNNDSNTSIFKNVSDSDAVELSHQEKLQLEEPSENFRSIPILPYSGDFLGMSPFVRPNVVEGKYQDTEHYLGVQFRLLREDFIKPLRDGIIEYKELIKQGKPINSIKDVKLYFNVRIVSQQMVRSGLIHIAKFSDKYFSNIRWECSKRFITGSLLSLSEDNFETILFATVAERRIDKLKKGFLMLKFEELNHEILSITPSKNFVVIEIDAYFEAYRHNLKALQELNESNFPMKRYIVEVEEKVLKPKYLEQNMTYDMRPLLLPLDKKYISFRHGFAEYNYPNNINSRVQEVNVLNQNCWPTSRELNLNPSQFDALKTAITKEFAIIQGPPGTGKTYTSLRIVQLLLHNMKKWTKNAQSSTILVVCYTNHALDQFLEGLTLFTKRIVRIGGQGKNKALQRYQLCNLKEKYENRKKLGNNSSIAMTYSELDNLEISICKLNKANEEAEDSILSEVELRKVMCDEHFSALFMKKYEVVGNVMYSWLGIKQKDINDCVFDITKESLSNSDLSIDMHGKRIVDINPKIRVQQQWIKFQKRAALLHTLADRVTEILNFCDPLPSILADIVQNVWEIDITVRWKLYKYWVQCFVKSKNEEYSRIMNDIKTDKTYVMRSKLQMLMKSINQSIESAFSCLLDEYVLKSCISYKHFVSLRESELNILNDAPMMFSWLQLKVRNQNLIKDRVRVAQDLRSVLLSLQNELKIMKSDVFVECEDEEYAEVEHIEAQRKIDSEEYDDVSFEEPIQVRRNEKHLVFCDSLQVQGSKKALNEFIKTKLRESPVMSEKEVSNVDNLWKLPLDKRWEIYKYWIKLYIERNQEKIYKYLLSFREKYKDLRELHSYNDIEIARDAHVVGMTTTGAAKYRHIIESINPAIVVVEEAAEILESHIITSLASCTQHVILIGDHQQLKPNPTVHMLAVKYNLNVSLFERMVNNGLQFQQLRIQHRMRPEISALLVPHIYEHLENHESVFKFENIRGVANNVYFIAHNFLELQDHNSKTKVNQHEAKFLIKLCGYFLQQNYEASQITILTTYSGQLRELTTLARGKLENVRITSVDSYQGEENDIILISFVRSNEAGTIGFLKVSNRVCVALSRAKKGLFCIGNFSLLADVSPLWKNITFILEQKDLIGVSLELKCQNHPNTSTFVKTDKDFECVPDGGCSLSCESSLPCGHKCPLKCHPFDMEHKEVLCYELCTKSCEEGHSCQKKCFKKCRPCLVQIPKVINPCNHEIMVDCYRKEEEISCPKQCERLLSCNHGCLNTCGETCTMKCLESCSIVSPHCGHKMKIQCFRIEDADFLKSNCVEPCGKLLSCQHICKGSCGKCHLNRTHVECNEKCEKLLSCGHRCLELCGKVCTTKCVKVCLITSPYCGHDMIGQCFRKNDFEYLTKKCLEPCNTKLLCNHICIGNCSSCHQGRLHIACNKRCDRILVCGHKCQSICSKSCPPCRKPCENWCTHGKCLKKCYESCKKCSEPCAWICPHQLCSRTCSDPCDRSPCNEPCPNLLECKHPCMGFCGEPCPKLCNTCNYDSKKFSELHDFKNKSNDKKYVYLEDCGHIIEAENLKNLMDNMTIDPLSIQLETCPECETTIKKNYRFGNSIKSRLKDIEYAKTMPNKSNGEYLVSLIKVVLDKNTHCVRKVLEAKRMRSIQELETMLNISHLLQKFDQTSSSNIFDKKFSIDNDVLKLKSYISATSTWISSFFHDDYLTASEQQLFELSWELHRFKLSHQILKLYLKSPDSELREHWVSLVQCVMTFLPFRSKDLKKFHTLCASLPKKYNDFNDLCFEVKDTTPFTDFSIEKFYKYSKGQTIFKTDDNPYDKGEKKCFSNEKVK